MQLSLKESAQVAHMSERQITRWIDDKRVDATKDDRGRWQIDLASLQKVTPLDSNLLTEISAAHGLTLISLASRIDAIERQLGL
jgi:hypothetical protein